MSEDSKIARAESNLQRQLDWVARHDLRTAFVAGVGITMLGVVASIDWNTVLANGFLLACFLLSLVLLFLSLCFIFASQYPKTKSPNPSVLYFGTIANYHFDDFKSKFMNMSESEYLNDLLCQTHINAQIINGKLRYLKIALSLLLIAVLPWTITIFLSRLAL
jgi:hypothetical protein